jgi:hypothetical protein
MSSFAMSGQITIFRPPNFIHKAEFQVGEVEFGLQNFLYYLLGTKSLITCDCQTKANLEDCEIRADLQNMP